MGFLLQLCGGRETKLRVNLTDLTLCLERVSTKQQGYLCLQLSPIKGVVLFCLGLPPRVLRGRPIVRTENMTRTRRLYTWTVLIALLGFAAPASAQYKPRPLNDPATGEKFHIEGGADFWFPNTEILVASGGTGALSGLTGTQINAKTDLGLTDKRLPKLQLMLRPA